MAQRSNAVRCPNCGRVARYDASNAFRPFCSERCKLLDLGQWATEGYRIAGDETPGDADDPEERT